MAQNRAWIAAAAAGALGVAAVWLAMPSTEPDPDEVVPVRAEPAPTQRRIPPPSASSLEAEVPPPAKARKGKGKGKGKNKAKGKARDERPARDPALEPDDRAALRDELREERIGSLADRLDVYASEAGWDPEVADRVAEIMFNTTDKISRNLARVDRGDAEWGDIRHELRDYRIDQAKRVRNLLGDEEFDRFVDGMDLGRFMGERPIRGRLD